MNTDYDEAEREIQRLRKEVNVAYDIIHQLRHQVKGLCESNRRQSERISDYGWEESVRRDTNDQA